MQADNPGKWMFECKIADHWNAGMFGFYNVSAACGQRNKAVTFNGKVREYFIAAEEMSWSYSPSQYNSFDAEPLNKTGRSLLIVSLYSIFHRFTERYTFQGHSYRRISGCHILKAISLFRKHGDSEMSILQSTK